MNGDVGDKIESLKQGAKEIVTSDWDYKVALAVITILAFITRFYGITHPDQVVFDEVHFGKVSGYNDTDAMVVDSVETAD